MLSLSNIQYQIEQTVILPSTNLIVGDGKNLLILGPSGCGKTTLLHIMAGLLPPSAGNLEYNDQSLYSLPSSALDNLRGRNFGFVFQTLHLVSALNVADNLKLAQSLAGQKKEVGIIKSTLQSLGLEEKFYSKPSALSQGEAQRVAIARAVIHKPKIIFADEPTAALDDHNCALVMSLLKEQATKNNASLIIATHDQRIKNHFEDILFLDEAKS